MQVPETTSEGLSEFVINLGCNVYSKDCGACVSDEKDPQYKLAIRLHLLGYDIRLEEAMDNEFQIGDMIGCGASKRLDIFASKGQAQVSLKLHMYYVAQVALKLEEMALAQGCNNVAGKCVC